jgi:hypothetical protein
MASLAPSFVMVHPNYVDPGILLPYSQASGAFDTLYGGQPQVRLGDGDLYVYMKAMDVRTYTATAQSAQNQLPSVSTTMRMISTPTYLTRVRAEYDHHDTAAMARWGVSIVEAQRLGMRQGTFQLLRDALLYGFNPANGEGLMNTVGATTVSLPADSFGNTTVVTYDNGEMGVWLLTQVLAVKTRTNQLGLGHKFTVLGPQRILGTLAYRNIVQLTSFQRSGGGSTTTAGQFKEVLAMNGDDIDWCYDDTLIGKGAGGTDAVIIAMPEVTKPAGSKINTNEFAKLAPGIDATTLMYVDKAAPTEIPTPLPGGAIDILAEMRTTSGWAVRPEAVTILSMQYQ